MDSANISWREMNSFTSGRRKPNLFIIGAAKSGTTSLHHHLARHPAIFMSEPKEPGFFVEELDYYPKDEEWYLGLFEEADSERYLGESSTHYTKLPTYPGVPERIAAYTDQPRMIYLMRDPIDRAISHYWHNTRQNAEFRPPLRAVKENPEFRAFSDYARQLEAYFRVFDRGSLFIETFERLVSEPDAVTAEIFQWLGIDEDVATEELPSKNRKPEMIERFLAGQKIGEFLYSDIWDRLSPMVPQPLKDLGKNVTMKAVRPSQESMEEVMELLRPWAQDALQRTSALLGREFPEWSTTQGER